MIGLSPVMSSIALCVTAAALEGLCAGKNVTSFFSSFRFPRYAPPLWAWSIIGGAYYAIFGIVLYRVFRLQDSGLRSGVISLVIFMLLVNALSNYVIFRMRDLRLSFVIGAAFPVFDLALFVCLVQLDRTAGIVLLPYLLYRAYAVWWGYSVWKLNPVFR